MKTVEVTELKSRDFRVITALRSVQECLEVNLTSITRCPTKLKVDWDYKKDELVIIPLSHLSLSNELITYDNYLNEIENNIRVILKEDA